MKKNIFLLFILILTILINPKTIKFFKGKLEKNSIKVQLEKDIKLNEKFNCVKYEDNIIYYDGKNLKSIDEKGEEVFNTKINVKNFKLYSNKYIDILDKDKSIILSVNKLGKIVFRKNVENNGLKYGSLYNDSYIYAYKEENKDYVNMYNSDGLVIKRLSLNGKIINIIYNTKYIYLCELKTEKKLESTITQYDYNGNLINKKNIKDSIILDGLVGKDFIYLIEKNKITKLDFNLNIKKEFNVNNIKSYSNLDGNGFYIIEQNDKVKHINNKIEEISISGKNLNLDGIVNMRDRFILYKDNKIINKKGEELKKFKSNIKKIIGINEHTLVLKLDDKLQILKIK